MEVINSKMNTFLKLTKIKFHKTTVSFKSWWLRFKSTRSHQMSPSTKEEAKPPEQPTSRENGPIEVLVFGSINMDYITYINELPKPGETMQAMYREQCFGGKGANQCMAAAKLGANCALIGKLGRDDLGNIYYKYLQQMGINTDFVEQLDGIETGIAQINVDDQAENTIVVLSGANQMLNTKDVSKAKKLFKEAKVLLCQLETNHKAVLCALKQFKGVSILNAAPAMKDMPPELIAAPNILCVNEVEAAQLTDHDEIKCVQDAKEAANELLAKGANSVIITMGALGAIYTSQRDPERCIHCPAAPVRYLADTSGAGDAFLGSLAYHILRFPNLNPESHIHAANICAAYAVGHRGTQPSFPGSAIAQDDLCMIHPNFYVIPEETPEEAAQRKQQPAIQAEAEPEAAVKPETVATPVAVAAMPQSELEPKPTPVVVTEEPAPAPPPPTPVAAAEEPAPPPTPAPTPAPAPPTTAEAAPKRASVKPTRASTDQTKEAPPKPVPEEKPATPVRARAVHSATGVTAAMVSARAVQPARQVAARALQPARQAVAAAHVVPGRGMQRPRKRPATKHK